MEDNLHSHPFSFTWVARRRECQPLILVNPCRAGQDLIFENSATLIPPVVLFRETFCSQAGIAWDDPRFGIRHLFFVKGHNGRNIVGYLSITSDTIYVRCSSERQLRAKYDRKLVDDFSGINRRKQVSTFAFQRDTVISSLKKSRQ